MKPFSVFEEICFDESEMLINESKVKTRGCSRPKATAPSVEIIFNISLPNNVLNWGGSWFKNKEIIGAKSSVPIK